MIILSSILHGRFRLGCKEETPAQNSGTLWRENLEAIDPDKYPTCSEELLPQKVRAP